MLPERLRKHLPTLFSFGAIQLAQIALPLLTLPWLARILGPDAFGLLMYMCLLPPIIALLMDWGLMTGCARTAARLGKRHNYADLLGAVLGARLILAFFCLCVCLLALPLVPHANAHPFAWLLAFLAGVARGSSPLWFFQGTGIGMRKMAIADVSASLMVLFASLVYIRHNDDWPLYLLFLAVFKGSAYSWLLLGLARQYGLRMGLRQSLATLWNTRLLFAGPVCATICNNGTQFVMGYWLPAYQMGIVSASHKMFRALASIINPFAQTIYPQACKLAIHSKKAILSSILLSGLLTFILMGIVTCIAYFMAPGLIYIALGNGYDLAVPVLRAMLFAVPLMACNQMIINQAILPLGLEKLQARAQGFVAIASLPAAIYLAICHGISGCAWLPFIIEFFVCLILCLGLWKYEGKHLYRSKVIR